MLVPCYTCSNTVEDFTTSSYRLTGGGPVVGRVCVDCAQGPTAEEQAKQDKHELAEFVNDQQEHELAHIDWDDVMERPKARQATAQLCICPKHLADVVYVDSIDGGNDEHDRLDGFYCINCNSFWREL